MDKKRIEELRDLIEDKNWHHSFCETLTECLDEIERLRNAKTLCATLASGRARIEGLEHQLKEATERIGQLEIERDNLLTELRCAEGDKQVRLDHARAALGHKDYSPVKADNPCDECNPVNLRHCDGCEHDEDEPLHELSKAAQRLVDHEERLEKLEEAARQTTR